jgi:hypothetical protein
LDIRAGDSAMQQGDTKKTVPGMKLASFASDRPMRIALAVLAVLGAIAIGFTLYAFWTNDLRWRLASPLVADFHFAERRIDGARISFSEDYNDLAAPVAAARIEAQGFSCSAISSAVECQRLEFDGAKCMEEWRLKLFLNGDNVVAGGRGEISSQCN